MSFNQNLPPGCSSQEIDARFGDGAVRCEDEERSAMSEVICEQCNAGFDEKWAACPECGAVRELAPHGSPLESKEIEEARTLVLACARKYGELDAKSGTTIPPAEFCEDTKVSKTLREAWLEGWRSQS